MTTFLANPAFVVFAGAMLVLCLNILGLWGYSGAVRGRTKTVLNPEDAKTVARGASVVATDPPEVARVLRAHRNATDNILPFAILAFLYVLAGATPLMTAILCGIFVVARVGHSFAYLGEKQPWRTLLFVVGGLDTLVLAGFLAKTLVSAA
jgi:uncharacterized MAPEG superfamily protein